MKYRNTRTGAVIDASSKIAGGNWVEISVAPAQPKEGTTETVKKETAVAAKKTTTKTTAKKPVAKKTTARK